MTNKKLILILGIMFTLSGLFGMFIRNVDENTNKNQKIKKVFVHDTVYVNNSFETSLSKCEGSLIDSLVIDKRKITTDGVPEHGRPSLELFGVGYPIYLKRPINTGVEIGIAQWGTTFDNPLWYSVGCHGKITPSKKEGHISCSDEWVVLIKEGD